MRSFPSHLTRNGESTSILIQNTSMIAAATAKRRAPVGCRVGGRRRSRLPQRLTHVHCTLLLAFFAG